MDVLTTSEDSNIPLLRSLCLTMKKGSSVQKDSDQVTVALEMVISDRVMFEVEDWLHTPVHCEKNRYYQMMS